MSAPDVEPLAAQLSPDTGDWRAVLTLAAPMVITTMSRTVMHFVDTFMVSRLGVSYAAAVGVGSILVFCIIGFGVGVMTAVNTFAAQCLGRQQYDQCSAYAWQAVWLACLIGAAGLLLQPLVEPLVALIGHEQHVQTLEVQYISITLLSLGPTLAASALSNFFNGVHRPVVTMVSAVVANVFNAAAAYVLIFGALGMPRMEVAGAALATVLATVVSAVILLAAAWWGSTGRRFRWRSAWRWQRHKAADLLRIGTPVGIQFILDVVAWALFLSWLVGRFGTTHIAASQFVWQYLHVSFMPAIGVSIAITAVVGRAIGEGRLDLAARRMRVGLICCCGYMGTMGVIFLALGRPLVSLFTHDPAVIHVGGHMMICAGIYQVFDGMCIAYNGGLRGAGDNRWPAIVMAVLCWSLVVGAGWLAVRYWPQGQSLGPWVTSTVYIIALAIALAYRWHGGRWRQMNLFTRPQPLQPPIELAAQPGPAE